MKTITEELPLAAPSAESCTPITGDIMAEKETSQEVIVERGTTQVAVQQINTARLFEIAMKTAGDSSIDVEKAERIISFIRTAQKEDEEAEERRAFNNAFALMQAEIPTIVERGGISTDSGKTIRSRYAQFEDIVDGVRPVLSKHGFGINFIINQEAGQISVTTILRHKQGHSIQTSFVSQADSSGSKNSIQAIGSTVSYAKRYGLCSLLSIATRGEDKDGNVDTGNITIEQAAEIDSRVRALGEAYYKRFMAWLEKQGTEKIMEIPNDAYKKVLSVIVTAEGEAKKAAEKKVQK